MRAYAAPRSNLFTGAVMASMHGTATAARARITVINSVCRGYTVAVMLSLIGESLDHCCEEAGVRAHDIQAVRVIAPLR